MESWARSILDCEPNVRILFFDKFVNESFVFWLHLWVGCGGGVGVGGGGGAFSTLDEKTSNTPKT